MRKVTKLITYLCIWSMLFACANILIDSSVIYAAEVDVDTIEINELTSNYTIQEFLSYEQYGYEKYNIFYQALNKLFVTDDYLEYRPIDTDKISVTGEIAVICGSDEEDDVDATSTISGMLENDEFTYIKKIYTGSQLPTTLSINYLFVDELETTDLIGYDMYIFEESAQNEIISEDMFLYLDKMVKDNITIVYNGSITGEALGTGEEDGSALTIMEDSNTVLIAGDDTDGYLSGIQVGDNVPYESSVGSPKHKKTYTRNVLWYNYINYHQGYYGHFVTVKVLPTYGNSTLNSSNFQQNRASHFRYVSTIVLPSCVKKIGDKTFSGYQSIENINLNAINEIGVSSFAGCNLLKNVTLGDNTIINSEAFSDCKLLESISLGVNTKIGQSAFDGCETLNKVTWGANTQIASHAFQNCKALDDIDLSLINKVEFRSFYGCNLSTLVIPENVVDIGSEAFGNTSIENLTIYANGMNIGDSAFYNSSQNTLKSINLIILENGLFLNKQAFREEIGELNITNTSNKSLFLFSTESDTWGESNITMEKLCELNKTSSISIKNVSGKDTHMVRFMDNWYGEPIDKGSVEVVNGTTWGDYFPNIDIQIKKTNCGYDYKFQGWSVNGTDIINETEIVSLNDDIVLYTKYEIIKNSNVPVITVNLPEYNKTLYVESGDLLKESDFPNPNREGDTFLGWTTTFPIRTMNDVRTGQYRFWAYKNIEITLYSCWQSTMDNRELKTEETLSGKPIYRINDNNIGSIRDYSKDKTYLLNQLNFCDEDVKNADKIKNAIYNAKKSKVAVLPKGYTVNVDKLNNKGYTVIKTGLELDDYISALTYMNCRYFQYLQLIQTPYYSTESELDQWDRKGIGYRLTVSGLTYEDIPEIEKGFEIEGPSFSKGFIYFIRKDNFKTYYDLCNRMEVSLNQIGDSIGYNESITITDALRKVNNLLISDYAYDNKKRIYDLNWFLQVTDSSANEEKYAQYHGVCASYSKLAYALLGQYGYEAIPTATGSGDGYNHSITQVVIDGNTYYCDYCWAGSTTPDRYMFLTQQELIFECHMDPLPDDMGQIVTYNRKDTTVSVPKWKAIKNKKNKKVVIQFTKVNNAKGYEVQYSTNRKFKLVKKKNTYKNKLTISKLKKGKTYYFRIRSYKNVTLYSKFDEKYKNVKYYSSWSKVKKIKIKK